MGTKRVGLARTQALIQNLKRELDMDGASFANLMALEVTGAVTIPYATTHKVIADGAVAENDIVCVSGYSGTKLTVAKAHPQVLEGSRGPFYVAEESASDTDEFSVVTTKLVSGVDTTSGGVLGGGGASYVGDKLWLSTTSGSSTLTLPSPTADGAQFSLMIATGRVVAVDASAGAYILQPPVINSPLMGQVYSGTGTATNVFGFHSGTNAKQYVSGSVLIMNNSQGSMDDDLDEKSANFRGHDGANPTTDPAGRLSITHEDPTSAEENVFTYLIWI